MSLDLVRAYRGALSRGYGYEVHDRGPSIRIGEVAGYFIDYRPKIPSHAENPNEVLYAADLAQLALGWWERVVLGERGAVDEFMALCALIEGSADHEQGRLLWPYRIELPKYNLRPPWYSAMAQGQIASVFVRAWQHSRDDRHADLALRAIEPLLDPGPEGMVTMTADGPVLEETPSSPPSHVLNGWIFALWGLQDVSTALHERRAEIMAAATTECLLQKLPTYDARWWSKYSLFPHPLPDLAKPFYHRLHITQLTLLHELTLLPEFGTWAARWRSYDRRVTAFAAVASKIPFVLTNQAVRARERHRASEPRPPSHR